MLKRLLAVGLLVGAVASLGLAAGPAFSADNGVVQATVTAATPCVIITPTAVAYGTHPFATIEPPGDSPATGSTLQVENCGDTSENVWARGADLTNANASAVWSLSSMVTQTTCFQDGPTSPTLNRYKHWIQVAGLDYEILAEAYLTTSNAAIGSVAARTAVIVFPTLYMPCSGSDGAGQLMSTTITFTATY